MTKKKPTKRQPSFAEILRACENHAAYLSDAMQAENVGEVQINRYYVAKIIRTMKNLAALVDRLRSEAAVTFASETVDGSAQAAPGTTATYSEYFAPPVPGDPPPPQE